MVEKTLPSGSYSVDKSEGDANVYDRFILENGLEVLLIQDNNLKSKDKSAP